MTPKQRAWQLIDRCLGQVGWPVQGDADIILALRTAVPVHGALAAGEFADCLIDVAGKAAGVIGATKEGQPLIDFKTQSGKYLDGQPRGGACHRGRNPASRSRRLRAGATSERGTP